MSSPTTSASTARWWPRSSPPAPCRARIVFRTSTRKSAPSTRTSSRAEPCAAPAVPWVHTTAAPPQGQGYQTAFAQIAADAVGVRYEDVDVVTGDTGAIPFGIGSFASRVTANAGPAILQAGGALREKILALAAHLLEAAPVDLEIVDGAARVRGVPDRR